MDNTVERIVNIMRDRYGERLYIPELAAEAFFSPFHFSRIFRRETGVAPGQYLTAVRLFEAKRLLLSTSFNVADIACQVGYRGIGTFTTRFSAAVGCSPGQYRRLPPGAMLSYSDERCRIPDAASTPAPASSDDTAGTVVAILPRTGGRRLFAGVFDSAVPQGSPSVWQVVDPAASPRVVLRDVAPGPHVLIVVEQQEHDVAPPGVFVRPLHVAAGAVSKVDVRLRPAQRTDPPIMVALGGEVALPQRLAM